MPILDHLSFRDYDQVYEPAEDSFLLMDALQQDLDALRASNALLVLEVGAGSGAISACVSQLLQDQRPPPLHLMTDINGFAASTAATTCACNGVRWAEVVQTDLVQGLGRRLQRNVDIMIFNPPYVPTPSEEVGSDGIEASWAGGVDGREVLDRLLPQIGDLLSPSGALYLVLVEENKPADIAAVGPFNYLLLSSLLARVTNLS